jgi:hypothetical protein
VFVIWFDLYVLMNRKRGADILGGSAEFAIPAVVIGFRLEIGSEVIGPDLDVSFQS